MTLELVVLAVVLAAILSMGTYTVVTGISPVPTTPKVRAAMLAAIPDVARPAIAEGLIVDLGSGWGNLALAAARRFPEAQVVGYERSPIPWLVACTWRTLARTSNVTFHRRDFRPVALGNANLVLCYLFPGGMTALKPKFEAELAAGCLVISNSFAVPGWSPSQKRLAEDLYRSPVYLYVMPPRFTAGEDGEQADGSDRNGDPLNPWPPIMPRSKSTEGSS